MDSFATPARAYAPGIGQAVADRTISRKLHPVTREELPALPYGVKDDRPFVRETWEEVALRVATGNSLLAGLPGEDFPRLHRHMRQASILMSGRHLQHTDPDIWQRNMEVLTNCSTGASSLILFYLLLNGSGVGRAYDDDMMLVDWCRNLPTVVPFIRADHADVLSGEIGQEYVVPGALLQGSESPKEVIFYNVADSREGWAKAIEQIEYLTWEGKSADKVLILDFSKVRPRGAPIKGMQGRPASGPAPLMQAISNIAKLKGQDMEPWKATLHVDHYLAECVLVGGARRAARMATKTWRDKNVIDFVNVKRGGVLWSSNNSVTVDADFWAGVRRVEEAIDMVSGLGTFEIQDRLLYLVSQDHLTDLDLHAHAVFTAVCEASYHDGTGEPGLINVDKLVQKDEGIEAMFDGRYAGSERFQLDERTLDMTGALAKAFAAKPLNMIVNPCGEIPLTMLGGYCVIADVVPFHARQGFFPAVDDTTWDDDAEDAFRTATRALIRVNTMDALYGKEVKRTNRIGVGFTGIHEYAWTRFGYGWKDLVDEQKSLPFWKMMARFSNAVVDEAYSYSEQLGVNVPHTVTTTKPAGTTSKLFGLSEGAHLPPMREYLRWVQFRTDDPLIEEYRSKGYPVKQLKTYSGTTVVGFPTVPLICTLGMGDKLVTAAEATPEEQYQFLRLLEKYWLHGHTDVDWGIWQTHDMGGQVSYTLKYDPKVVGFEEFRRTLLEGQSSIKCCSVMPQIDTTAYEYQPEQPISREEFDAIVARIESGVKEDVGFEHVDCASGSCPIDFLGSEA